MNGRQPFAAMDVAAGWQARTIPMVDPEHWIDIDPFNSILCANSVSDVNTLRKHNCRSAGTGHAQPRRNTRQLVARSEERKYLGGPRSAAADADAPLLDSQ
jgi:hypothetical protein